jgi:hypothetical protein
LACENFASRSVYGNVIPLRQRGAVRAERALLIINLDTRSATHTNFSHLSRNQRGMRRHAATRGQNAFGGDHATQVFRRSFNAGEHDLVAFLGTPHCFFRAEDNMTGSRAGAGRQSATNFFCGARRLTVKDRRQQMRE